jgi:alkanesulfonate monooxygenase SsuD/methylene tetrahydromethanopterin reductase-like flavin-dependent oxidoreductase (luciferase family)
MGFGPQVRKARTDLDGDGRPDEVVPDELIEAVCVWGAPERARARLDEYREAGADVVVVYPVPAGEAVSSMKGTLMASAPEA